jgi:hypothetical protein
MHVCFHIFETMFFNNAKIRWVFAMNLDVETTFFLLKEYAENRIGWRTAKDLLGLSGFEPLEELLHQHGLVRAPLAGDGAAILHDLLTSQKDQ